MSPKHFPIRKNLLLAGAVLATLGAATPVEADTITVLNLGFNFNDSLNTTPPNNTDSLLIAGDFAGFNPALGTLTQVDIEFLSRITGDVRVTGLCTGGVSCNPDASSDLELDLAVNVDGLTPVFSSTILTGANCTFVNSPTVCSGSENIDELFNGSFLVPAGGGSLLDFIGPGTIPFSVTLDGVLSCSSTPSPGTVCNGNADFQWANGVGLTFANLTVTYTYTPAGAAPEPGSLALFGLGAAGLWLTRRRHPARSS